MRRHSKSDSWGLDQDAIPTKRSRQARPGEWSVNRSPSSRFRQKPRTGLIRGLLDLLQYRGVSQAIVVVVLILLIGNSGVLQNSSFGSHIGTLTNGISRTINGMRQPIGERAAFFIVDDFQSGIENWLSQSGRSIEGNTDGLKAFDDMFLRDDTLRFSSYRVDFRAKIESGAVGWMVRASDFDNYYGFKLIESSRNRKSSFHLERFAVINGARTTEIDSGGIPLPEDLAQPGQFNKISVRVRDQQITTMVNGRGIDFWRDARLPRGGVGLFASGNEVALVEQFTVRGNEDPWGLLLYGTVQTFRSVRDRLSSQAVIVFSPVPAQYLRER